MDRATVEMPAALLREAERAARETGFENADEFVRWAVEAKLRELKRDLFCSITDRVKQGLADNGETLQSILDDFERFRV